jgi:hypothetical protein
MTKRIFLALRPNVTKELNVTSDQRGKMLEAFGDSLQMDGDRIRLQLTGGQNLEEMEEQAMKALAPAQLKRLEEIWIQNIGGVALADDKIAKKVGLTGDQKSQVEKLVDEAGTSVSDLMAAPPSPENGKKIGEVRAKCGKKLEALLTDDQRKTFQELKGKPFEFKKAS